MQLDGEKALQTALANGFGLPAYMYIMKSYQHTDVSQDDAFQRQFNGFYKVRRNKDWRGKYYQIFEQNKKKQNVSFENILCNIYVLTDTTEPSFASKMLATLNPDMPIWDSKVLDYLGISWKGSNASEKQDNAILLYDEIVNWYMAYIKTKNGKENIDAFNHYLPDYTWLSDVKKIDYMIWAIG